MKTLSLLQPWATLVVIGAKHIETRSWDTKYRGPLLIHASKKATNEQKELIPTEPFWSALKHLEELPLGEIIGKVDVIGTSTTDFYLQCKAGGIPLKDYGGNWDHEIAFGDIHPAGSVGCFQTQWPSPITCRSKEAGDCGISMTVSAFRVAVPKTIAGIASKEPVDPATG